METHRADSPRLRERRLGAALARVDNATGGRHNEDDPITRERVAEILGPEGADLVADVLTDVNSREDDWS